jgi:methionine synthase I (cobalamin-dependent)/5,10-methylenetetrahydrofolate reductase
MAALPAGGRLPAAIDCRVVSTTRPHVDAAKTFADRLQEGVVVCDGAMGTMLYARGVFVNRCFDELNLSNADLVRAVHAEYVDAGADVVETNTFGAHRLKLGPHGFDAQVVKINREGARVAREAAAGRAVVAGAIGPLGKPLEPFGNVSFADAKDVYGEQVQGLVEGGVDLFLVETMPSLDQARAAFDAIRAQSALPIVVSLTFTEEGTTFYGDKPEDVVKAAEEWGAAAVGANCSQGPQPMLETVQRMAAAATRVKISAQPNAGAPAMVDGRYVYLCTPEYMASYARRFIEAGVTMVGGCCGTTPAHIRNLVRSVRMVQPARQVATVVAVERAREAPAPIPREEKSALARKLGKQFVVSVELDPPKGADPGRIIDRAQYCKENEVDAINVADGPRASARMSAQSLCVLMQRNVGVDTILHYTCRDRNLLGIQSDLLGAYALGLRNILAITGDPPKLGDYPDATAVYDVDSIGLIRIMSHLNNGCDLAGNPIGPALGIHIGCGADPSKPDWEKEVFRLEEKVKAGAEYVMTQPVYDPRTVERFLGLIKHLNVPVLIGILPLYSHRNAEFLHNEVPGMIIPEDIRERMRIAGSGEEAQAEGVRIAQEALVAAREQAQGAYIMPPFNKVELAVRVIEALD